MLIGLAVALVLAKVRRHIEDPMIDTTLSFVAPFLAYLPAEGAHASGVLAVVVTGIVLGHKAPVLQSASSRLSERINWSTVQFLLENAVFLLIGLQVKQVVQEARAGQHVRSAAWPGSASPSCWRWSSRGRSGSSRRPTCRG